MCSNISSYITGFSDIKDGSVVTLINEPDGYREIISTANPQIKFQFTLNNRVDLIHLFTKSKKELSVEFPRLMKYLNEHGAFWISWPKEKPNFITDLDEVSISEMGNSYGLMSIEKGSIDDNWLVLKFKNKNKV